MRAVKPESKQPLGQQRHTVKERLQTFPTWGWILAGLVIFVGIWLVASNGSRFFQKTNITTGAKQSEAEKVVEGEFSATTNRITLDMVIRDNPLTLDPALAVDAVSAFFIRQMFVGLTGFDEHANVVPALATRWDVSDDGLQWTFYLRDDMSWVYRNPNTGEFKNMGRVTAHDVVYGVSRTLDPRTASDYTYVLYIIAGAEELNKADPKAENFDELLPNLGVNAPDASTVVFTLKEPAAYFPSIAGIWLTYPQPQATVEKWGNDWTQAGLIVTNGPYTLRQWDHDTEIWLEKNPLWIDAEKVQIEQFGGPIMQEATKAMAMYENNEIDLMAKPGSTPPLADMERIRADAQLSQELFTAPRLCTYYYGFVQKPPFDKSLVRKAFAAAIDRLSLIENVIQGGQRPAHAFSPPGVFGNVADDLTIGRYLVEANYADQVSQAQKWLAEAGYPRGKGLEVVLGYNTSEAHAQIAQSVRMMWQKAFPQAKITIKEQEWAAYLDTLDRDAPDEDKPNIYRLGWCADYPDANNWLNDAFNSKSGSNYAKFKNAKFDALVEEAAFESDPSRRQELYRQAEDIFINQDVAIAPIFYYSYNRLHKPWLTEVVINPVIGDPIAEWRIDWEAKKAAVGR